jgi:glycine cleavage system H protein
VKLLSGPELPEGLLFSQDHIWVRIVEKENPQSKVYVGLADFAQQDLGLIEFVRILPKGRYVSRGHPFGSIESRRRIMLLRAPVFGLIKEINEELREHPELINTDPYQRGWIAAFQPFQLEEDRKVLVSKPEELHQPLVVRPR